MTLDSEGSGDLVRALDSCLVEILTDLEADLAEKLQ